MITTKKGQFLYTQINRHERNVMHGRKKKKCICMETIQVIYYHHVL